MTCSDNSPAWVTHIASYAAAFLRLCLAAWADDGDGVLRNVDVVLCEDLKTVMVYATHKNGKTLCACFDLPDEAVEESAFDPSAYVDAFTGIKRNS